MKDTGDTPVRFPPRGELLFALSLGVSSLVFGVVNLAEGDVAFGLILVVIGVGSTSAVVRFLLRAP